MLCYMFVIVIIFHIKLILNICVSGLGLLCSLNYKNRCIYNFYDEFISVVVDYKEIVVLEHIKEKFKEKHPK